MGDDDIKCLSRYVIKVLCFSEGDHPTLDYPTLDHPNLDHLTHHPAKTTNFACSKCHPCGRPYVVEGVVGSTCRCPNPQCLGLKMAARVAAAERMQEGVVVGRAAEGSGAELALAAASLVAGLVGW